MLDSPYNRQINRVVEAIELHRSGAISWFGRNIYSPTSRQKQLFSPKSHHLSLLILLEQHLYENFYCPGNTRPNTELDDFATEPVNFAMQLIEANHGKGCWEDGWRVVEQSRSGLIVEKEHLKIRLSHKQAQHYRPDANRPDYVSILLRKDLPSLTPGFYMAFGDIYLPEHSNDWIRLYWNVDASGAVALMDAATSSINDLGVPFRLKVLRKIEQSTRCDTAVLYLHKHDWPKIKSWVAETHSNLSERMGALVPALTCKLAHGLSIAEDPGQGASFGLHICNLIAEGLLSTLDGGKYSITERRDAVLERFRTAGVNIDTPYLNPGSSAEGFELSSPQTPQLRLNEIHEQPFLPEVVEPLVYLELNQYREVAKDICDQLIKDAYWYERKCNWMGTAIPGVAYNGKVEDAALLSAIGPDLYRGSAGIALFLGEYYALTRLDDAKRTALGAIKCALEQLEMIPVSSRFSLFSGWIGIAYAAARLGKLLNEGSLFDSGVNLALGMCAQPPGREQDLLSGNAGALMGLLELWKLTNNSTMLNGAIGLGRNIVDTAKNKSKKAIWSSSASPEHRNPVGLAHGAAGIGYALMELFKKTNEHIFLETAESAFQFERGYFDENEGNWLDFRLIGSQHGRIKYNHFATAWCYGAPGIALSRISAYQLTQKENYRSEALTALETTEIALQRMLEGRIADFCLCHGIAGLAEVLNFGCLMESQTPKPTVLSLQAASIGKSRFASSYKRELWPLGINVGEPGLMLGIAGIGLFYLRLIDPQIPSPLLAFSK